MTQPYRLLTGGLITRGQPLRFTFNGQSYQGYEGDTLAAALLANGVHLVGRGFKFHRPRGIMSAGAEECNALIKLGSGGEEEPNARATMQPLYDGLTAASQNCWPNVNFDLSAGFDLVAGLLPAGFYNKTFMWPNWHWYEWFVRRAAGLGTLPKVDDPDYYMHQNRHCDVLVCGGGAAGISAAMAAAATGARVMLVEQSHQFGGNLLWRPCQINDMNGSEWLAMSMARLKNIGQVTLLKNATLTGYFDHNTLLISERLPPDPIQFAKAPKKPRERLWKVRARKVIIATGAIEQPMLFPNNDRPGIMLASAVRQYLNQYAVLAGRQVVVATNNDSAYQTALDLHDAGVKVEAVVDSRPWSGSTLIKDIEKRGITLLQNCIPMDTSGRKGVESIQLARRDEEMAKGFKPSVSLACDCIAMSGGWQPTVHLHSQARGRLRYSEELCAFLPDSDNLPEHLHTVGAANGAMDLSTAMTQGHEAGLDAASALGFTSQYPSINPIVNGMDTRTLNIERYTLKHKPARQWVDFQHDVTLRDIDIAVQENYVSVEHLKRYTTTGMSIDQGKTSNLNALVALAEHTGKSVEKVGTTTFRPFYTPVTLGAIAGRRRGEHYAPVQRSPLYHRHETLGANFWDYGSWRRPAAYPRKGETLSEAIQREALAVRKGVGIFDGSPLGKIEVRGKDAAEFLNRIYVNNVLSLAVGRTRYGLMLNENGTIIDDGIFARLAEDHFLVHTTSGGATRIYAWMEEWLQGEWPHLDVLLTPVTTQWANIAISGPKARAVLERTGFNTDLSGEGLPHMHICQTTLQNIPVRLMRASFTGELGYEINVPADYGAALWGALTTAGEAFKITPYGIESLMVLRTEKGYLHVGADTDGNTTPADVGWGAVVEKKSTDFIGKRSLSRPKNQEQDRLQFVGLSVEKHPGPITAGAHVIDADKTAAPAPSQGYVTSACYSPNLKRWIALGLVNHGRERIGEGVNLFNNGHIRPATIVDPTFYDLKGERLHD